MKSERDDVEFWVIGGAQSVQREEFAKFGTRNSLPTSSNGFLSFLIKKCPMFMRKSAESGGCTLATTKTESFGNTFIESMVCGVPVVASKMMPVTELVVHGEHGLLYRDQNVEDAVQQLYEIVDNPDLHQQMSQAAINHVHENFAIEVVAEQYVQLLKNLAGTEPAHDKDGGVKTMIQADCL